MTRQELIQSLIDSGWNKPLKETTVNQLHPTESEMDNILVHQKNRILGLINEGRVVEAQAILTTVSELWSCCGYSYKEREILERISAIRDECTHQFRSQIKYEATKGEK